MADLLVHVPFLLRGTLGDRPAVTIEATTLEQGLATLFSSYPLLERHVHDDHGVMRQHVFIAFNGRNIAHMPDRKVALRDGDRIDVLQAVSGG